jgi:alkylhydroperoxidase/carboxymuconolactone decarboxylase family protein YurZ/catechol 2,3-dioxygenase-like lactoylglutathione lyase family enzyme
MKGLHHVGFTVSNLERTIDFYHNILGLEFANEPTDWFSGEALDKGINVPGAQLKLVSFKVGESGIEFLEYAAPSSPNDRPLPNNGLGAGHIAFFVEDIAAKKKELEAKGIKFYSDINLVDEGPLAGWRWVYFSDPDGISLELVEIAYTRPEERAVAIQAYKKSRGWLKEKIKATDYGELYALKNQTIATASPKSPANAVLDDKELQAALKGINPKFGDFCTRVAGEAWGLPLIDQKTKAFIAIAVDVMAQNQVGPGSPFGAHVMMALKQGATRAEIEEVLLFMCAYAGFNKAAGCFGVLNELLEG